MLKLFILLICFSCTDLILQDTTEYHSIQLNGNAWIHIKNDDNEENDISIMDDAFTLEFWFTGGNSGNSESACLVSIIDIDGAIKFGLYKDPFSPNTLDLWLNNTRLDPIPLNPEVDLNSGSTFHHIAITSDENIQIYLDGILLETSYIGMSINIDENDLAIGAEANLVSFPENFWAGNFDEIRLWSSVLSSTAITYHANNPEKVAESFEEIHITTLTGLWRFQFEDGDTFIIPDESCSIVTQIYTNAPSLCSNVDDAIIYTLEEGVATFSERHP